MDCGERMTEATHELESALSSHVSKYGTDTLSRPLYAIAVALINGCSMIAEAINKKRNSI